MNRTFRMNKMLARLEKEGRLSEVTTQIMELMTRLDGRTGTDYNWQSVVGDEPLVLIRDDDFPHGVYVNVDDCD